MELFSEWGRPAVPGGLASSCQGAWQSRQSSPRSLAGRKSGKGCYVDVWKDKNEAANPDTEALLDKHRVPVQDR